MRVLTLHQPWASLMAHGVKWIETRPNSTNVRGMVAIHAAASVPKYAFAAVADDAELAGDEFQYGPDAGVGLAEACSRLPGFDLGRKDMGLPTGAILSVHRLYGCLPMVWDDGIDDEHPPANPVLEIHASGLALWEPWTVYDNGRLAPRDVTGQLQFGNFAQGRFAWLFSQPTEDGPLAEPVPFRGGQGWSREWHPVSLAELIAP